MTVLSEDKSIYSNCKFRKLCKTQDCSFTCYPFTFLHGIEGDAGIWAKTLVPKKYQHCLEENLPEIEPTKTLEKMKKFISKVEELVAEGNGLYLFSPPAKENPLGTGTGKTTVACTILNEYTIKASKSHLQNVTKLTDTPALFVSMSEFQNIYNSQFRGSKDAQESASNHYYWFKDRMKKVQLLVLDDIALRGVTEAFTSELYEIINARVNEGKSVIYTSNVTLHDLASVLGDRITSRIEGSTFIFPLTGKDHRRKEW